MSFSDYRQSCYWYRPWKDMNATIQWCALEDEIDSCPCTLDCSNYISERNADKIVKWAQENR